MSARSTRFARHALSALLLLGLAACQADQKQPTYGLMLGIRTNLEVTKDVDSVRIAIWQGGGFGGRPVYDWEYALDRGHALPATLAIVSLNNQSPQEPIQVTVEGKRNGFARTSQEFTTLLPPYDSSVHELGSSPVDSRRQFLPAPDSGGAPDEMADVAETTGLRFLDSSIDWLCANSDADGGSDDGFKCSDDKTCVAGNCVDKHLELSDLPPYRGEQAAGGQGGQTSAGCFEVANCFAGAKLVTPTVGDLGQCELDASVDSNVNFAIALPTANDGFCDESHCYVPLDHDVTTGWIETATGVRLPQRVCDRTGSEPSNVQVAISRRCESKTRSQAPCQPTNNGAGGGSGGGGGGGGSGVGGGGGNSQGGSDAPAPIGGTGGAPGGTNQPIVSDTSPSKDATAVDPYATIRVTFSKPLDATSIDEKSFRVLDGSSSVPGTVTYAPGKTDAVFSPAKPLALLAHYVVELDASIRDENGLALRNAFSFEFSVRDGTWGKPIDVGSADAAPLELAGGDSGEAMLLWSQDGFIQSQHFANDAWTSMPALSNAPKGTDQAALAWQDGVGAYAALSGTQDVGFFHFDGASWSAAGDLSLTIADRVSLAQRDGDVRALLQVGGSLSTYKYSGSAFAGQVKVVDAGPPNPALLAAALVLDKAHNVLVYWSGKTNQVESVMRTPSDETSGSVTWANAAHVSAYTAGLNDLHAFVDGSGHFTVIWAAGSGWDMLDSIFAAESDDGMKWSTPTKLASSSGTLSNLRVVQRGQAGLLAVYQETSSGTAQMRSIARAGSATKFAQPVTIAQDGGLPAVALDPHGNALVFFQGKGSPQMVRYQAATNGWASSDTTMHDVKLIVDGYGRATAAWLDASGAPPGKQVLKLARFY